MKTSGERSNIDEIGRKLAVYGTYICNRQHHKTGGHICSFLVCPSHDKPYSQAPRPEISITLTNQEVRKQRSVYLARLRLHPECFFNISISQTVFSVCPNTKPNLPSMFHQLEDNYPLIFGSISGPVLFPIHNSFQEKSQILQKRRVSNC